MIRLADTRRAQCPALRIALILACLFLAPIQASSETIAVAHTHLDDTLANQTLTFFWPATKAKATLVMIPGGLGHINLKPETQDLRHPFYQGLKSLSSPSIMGGRINVVIFDNPTPLASSRSYPVSRTTEDHLSRIDEVIQFYRKKTGKPIYLLGHSNGSISVTEYLRFKKQKSIAKPIAGLILSGARNEAYLHHKMNIRTLLIHHTKDGCINTTLQSAKGLYSEMRKLNGAPTSFREIDSDAHVSGDPCNGGFHMYAQGEVEFAQALAGFILGK